MCSSQYRFSSKTTPKYFLLCQWRVGDEIRLTELESERIFLYSRSCWQEVGIPKWNDRCWWELQTWPLSSRNECRRRKSLPLASASSHRLWEFWFNGFSCLTRGYNWSWLYVCVRDCAARSVEVGTIRVAQTEGQLMWTLHRGFEGWNSPCARTRLIRVFFDYLIVSLFHACQHALNSIDRTLTATRILIILQST